MNIQNGNTGGMFPSFSKFNVVSSGFQRGDQTKMQRKARTKSQKWYPSTSAEHNGFRKILPRPPPLRLTPADLLNVKCIQTKLSFAVAPTLTIRRFLLHCYVHNFPNSWWTLTLVHPRLPILNFFTSSATICQIYSLMKP